MEVTMYSTPTCGYCKKAKDYFKQLGINVREIDITKNEQAANELVRKTGQTAVPVIILKGQTIIGFDKNKIDSLLNI